jgi:hypothetical protein
MHLEVSFTLIFNVYSTDITNGDYHILSYRGGCQQAKPRREGEVDQEDVCYYVIMKL